MIPTEKEATALWDTYKLPEKKRIHVALVARVALWFATKLKVQNEKFKINEELLNAAALLHDIDKAIPTLPGERHPDTAVRVLRAEGMGEVADVVKTHSLHGILDPSTCPTTWEEKLLYLADKMVKQEVVGVDGRFALWRAENLPKEALTTLEATYPLVKQLEGEVSDLIGVPIDDMVRLLQKEAA